MIDVAYLSKLYAEKLLATSDHQAAFLKAVWVAYKEGIKDGADAILPPGSEGQNTQRPPGSECRQPPETRGYTPSDTKLPEMGDSQRATGPTPQVQSSDVTNGGCSQLGPHNPRKSQVRLRFDRTTKLTHRALESEPSKGK